MISGIPAAHPRSAQYERAHKNQSPISFSLQVPISPFLATAQRDSSVHPVIPGEQGGRLVGCRHFQIKHNQTVQQRKLLEGVTKVARGASVLLGFFEISGNGRWRWLSELHAQSHASCCGSSALRRKSEGGRSSKARARIILMASASKHIDQVRRRLLRNTWLKPSWFFS